MTDCQNNAVRNLAIIAHVDHGKTTLVDALLKQGQVFRDHQQVGALIMDTNPLERERGITILAKNASVSYGGVRINIIDTPGHADFSGEVERVMNMADGCLLLVDAVDGPMPQTTYVLRQALQQNVRPIVVINKIDRPEARVTEVVAMVQDLFLNVVTRDDQLDYPVLYTSARQGCATTDPNVPGVDMQPLFQAILDSVPPPTGDPGAHRCKCWWRPWTTTTIWVKCPWAASPMARSGCGMPWLCWAATARQPPTTLSASLCSAAWSELKHPKPTPGTSWL